MELYVGGMAQGKLSYVLKKYSNQFSREDIADGASSNYSELARAKVISHFHVYIKREMESGKDVYQSVEKLVNDNKDVKIICDEVGAGIVPMKEEEREYRELVGRICCILAKKADCVERIICGMGVQLK